MSCLTGKVRYRDRIAATHALPIRQRRDQTRVRECGSCGGWHVVRTPRD